MDPQRLCAPLRDSRLDRLPPISNSCWVSCHLNDMIAPTARGCKRAGAKLPEFASNGPLETSIQARKRRHGIVSANHNTAQLPPSDRRPALRKETPALARSFRFRIPQPPAPRGRQDRACSQVVYPHTGPTRVGPFSFWDCRFFHVAGGRAVTQKGPHSWARVKRASPESIATTGSMDSGPALSESALADL